MYKTKSRFPGVGHVSLGRDEDDEAPLHQTNNRGTTWSSEAMASQVEAYYQGARRHKSQNPKSKKQQLQTRSRRSPLAASWCEDQPVSAFTRLGHTPASQKRQHWSTTWHMQMSAVVVALALAALIGLTFALRHADKVRDFDLGLDVDSDDARVENAASTNATIHDHAALDDGGGALPSTGNGSQRDEAQPQPSPASGYRRNGGGQSKNSAYNTRFFFVTRQPSIQKASPSPQQSAKRSESVRRRTLVRMNRKEWLNSRGWHLA